MRRCEAGYHYLGCEQGEVYLQVCWKCFRWRKVVIGVSDEHLSDDHPDVMNRIAEQRAEDERVARERGANIQLRRRETLALHRMLASDTRAVPIEVDPIDFSIGRDTDHLLALDSWNEYLMRGMENGYHV